MGIRRLKAFTVEELLDELNSRPEYYIKRDKLRAIVIEIAHATPPEDVHIRWIIKEAQKLLKYDTD